MTKLKSFKPQSNNANKHTPRGLGMLDKSIAENGWIGAITTANDGETFDGSARLEASYERFGENVEPIIIDADGTRPIIVRRTDIPNADDPKAKKLAIAANRIAQVDLDWDAEILASIADDVDISDMFFDEELAAILGEEAESGQKEEEDEDALDESLANVGKVESRVKLGEIWQLGRHKIACGDSTVESNVRALLGDREIELLFTSPPYSDMRDYKDGTDVSLSKICGFIPAWANHANYMAVNLGLKFKDGAVVPYWQEYIDTANNSELKLLAWNVWDKQKSGSVASATNMFFLTHEWIFVFGEKRKKLERTIPNKMDEYMKRHGEDLLSKKTHRSVREKDGSMSKTTTTCYTHHQLHSVIQCYPELGTVRSLHPAIYPIELPTQYLAAITGDQDNIADPFLGSGTTIIAAQKMGGDRTVYGFELSPDYCEVIIARYENFTGDIAKLVGRLQ